MGDIKKRHTDNHTDIVTDDFLLLNLQIFILNLHATIIQHLKLRLLFKVTTIVLSQVKK